MTTIVGTSLAAIAALMAGCAGGAAPPEADNGGSEEVQDLTAGHTNLAKGEICGRLEHVPGDAHRTKRILTGKCADGLVCKSEQVNLICEKDPAATSE